LKRSESRRLPRHSPNGRRRALSLLIISFTSSYGSARQFKFRLKRSESRRLPRRRLVTTFIEGVSRKTKTGQRMSKTSTRQALLFDFSHQMK
jgi:hypothetical protein